MSQQDNFFTIKFLHMNSLIFRSSGVILFVILVLSNACKKDDNGVDCSTVTGATFTTNSGKIASILGAKCSNANCHGTGGAGAVHWAWSTDYEMVKEHFEHMLEAIEEGSMPKAGSTQLTDEEKDQLECWKSSGYPK
jgi:uncharacterized membrane protein